MHPSFETTEYPFSIASNEVEKNENASPMENMCDCNYGDDTIHFL